MAAAGVLLVSPAIIGAIPKPLPGLDVGARIPVLSTAGIRIGYNVVIGLLVFAAAFILQRARPA